MGVSTAAGRKLPVAGRCSFCGRLVLVPFDCILSWLRLFTFISRIHVDLSMMAQLPKKEHADVWNKISGERTASARKLAAVGRSLFFVGM